MLVSDLIHYDLPQEFLDCLPTTCPFCNTPTEITVGLTALSCTNPFCSSRLGERMVAMLADLGIKNLGPAKCQQFIATYNVKSPYALFEFAKRDGTAVNVLSAECSKEFSDQIAAQINEKRKLLLWEYVKVGNLPGIRDSARKLFQDYGTIEDFYKDLDNKATGGINFIAKLLDIRNEYSGYIDLKSENLALCSVKAVEVFRTLQIARQELWYYQQFFDIEAVADKSVNICLSTAVGKPYTSKTDFVMQMNKIYGSQIHINQLSSVTKQCDILVWSKQGSATSKVQKARKLGTPILTGVAFNRLLSAYLKSNGDLAALAERAALLEDEKGAFTEAQLLAED